jgi:hypothetical protein
MINGPLIKRHYGDRHSASFFRNVSGEARRFYKPDGHLWVGSEPDEVEEELAAPVVDCVVEVAADDDDAVDVDEDGL